MTLPRYAKYNESGIPMLGEIPSHWTMVRLKHVASIDNSGCFGSDPEFEGTVLPVATTAQIDQNGRFDVDQMPLRSFEDSELARYGCADGDILVVKSSGSATNIISGKAGLVVASTPQFIFSNFLMRVRPNRSEVMPRFVYFLLISHLTRERIQLMCSTTTYPNLDVGEYTSSKLPFPPVQEQEQIVTFLDRESARIDALVAEQEKLTALLKEKRQALISHAVTKGLNPDAPMKDSGIEWLSTVPAHWHIIQSRRLFRVRSEKARAGDRQLTASQKHGVIFQSDFVESEGRRVVEVIKGIENLLHAEPNDFVISMRSFQGGIEWCRFGGSISFHYVMLVPVKHVHEPFFARLFKSLSYIQALRSTTDLIRDGQEIRYSHFAQVHLPVIPIDEQIAIATFLDRETGKLDVLVAEAELAISLLKERRSALISAAVTGKIDVRNLVKIPA